MYHTNTKFKDYISSFILIVSDPTEAIIQTQRGSCGASGRRKHVQKHSPQHQLYTVIKAFSVVLTESPAISPSASLSADQSGAQSSKAPFLTGFLVPSGFSAAVKRTENGGKKIIAQSLNATIRSRRQGGSRGSEQHRSSRAD